MATYRLTIYRDASDEYRWRLEGNGRIIADSGEGYVRRAGALRAARRIVYIMQHKPVRITVEQ